MIYAYAWSISGPMGMSLIDIYPGTFTNSTDRKTGSFAITKNHPHIWSTNTYPLTNWPSFAKAHKLTTEESINAISELMARV